MRPGRAPAKNALLFLLAASSFAACGAAAGGWQAGALGKIDSLDAELAERHTDLLSIRHKAVGMKERELRGAQRMVVRASFDVGSGAVKVTVAEVDLHQCINGHVNRVLFEKKENLLLAEDLERSVEASKGKEGAPDPEFSAKACAQLQQVVRELKRQAEEAGAVAFSGAATAAFRKASNGPSLLKQMEDEMGVRLRVISQEQEASLGWACVNDQFRDQGVGEIVVWDSGGGSFQVSGFEMGRHTSWLRDVGSASTLATLVRSVQGCSLADTASPNPVSVEQAQALARALKVQIGAPPGSLEMKLSAPGVRLYGIGGDTSIFALAAQTADHADISKASVLQAIEGLCGKTDDQLRRVEDVPGAQIQPHLVIPKLILLYAVLDLLGAPHVTYLPTNGLCGGILVTPDFWCD
mmetsp:Transcript_64592/g.154122  ORF Transcript_64592/g.154122 Transcript_64592/m.154122 type:complete len:410 (+) Transcript_64592:268-1497(+)